MCMSFPKDGRGKHVMPFDGLVVDYYNSLNATLRFFPDFSNNLWSARDDINI